MIRFNTQPPEGGWKSTLNCAITHWFQHSAARRRLVAEYGLREPYTLFQHSAARRRLRLIRTRPSSLTGFNTQPPEGGCVE